jgi:hypothetical protein
VGKKREIRNSVFYSLMKKKMYSSNWLEQGFENNITS